MVLGETVLDLGGGGSGTTSRPDPGGAGGGRRVREPRLWGIRSVGRLKAWMLVVPVDALALSAPALRMPEHVKAVVLMAVASMVLLHGAGSYRARLHLSVLDEMPALVGRLLAAAAIVGALFAVTNVGEELVPFLAALLGTIGLVVLGRVVVYRLILAARRRRVVAHRTVVVGGGARAAEMHTLLTRYPQYGLRPLGVVGEVRADRAGGDIPHLGTVGDLEAVVARHRAAVILIADAELAESEVLDVVRRPGCAHADLLVVPQLPQFHARHGQDDHIGSIPVVRIRMPTLSGPGWAVKRAADIAVSGTALVLLAPVMAAIAVGVRLEGGPGVLFRQDRVGRHGEVFRCLKFRSMRPATEKESETTWSIAGDDRIGPVGRFLRRTSLDETPQFWSILRGDMTLIGPRPERPHFVEKFSAEVEHYEHRHRVRAGLTGLAQVSGLRGDTPITDRARFDNYYIENWSLWLDVKVALRTIGEVLCARGR